MINDLRCQQSATEGGRRFAPIQEKMSENDVERLWEEYSKPLEEFDDLTLARWLCQLLSQVRGKSWRFSHPLVATARMVARIAHKRQIWLKRMAEPPAPYFVAECCRAPLVPLVTRDIRKTGLICLHCDDTAIPFEDMPSELRELIAPWGEEYEKIHQVAHYSQEEQDEMPDYEGAMDEAAEAAEDLMGLLALQILPAFAEHYGAVVFEDHDECLEVRPEDIDLGAPPSYRL